ncbi:MAG: hypothetical protein ACOX0U_09330 [Oscillospiraceae bacterium]
MDSDKKTIQFIDSQYRELFRIPDGESIRVTYPPEDGRGIVTRPCKAIGEMHVRVGNSDYHICELAEAMERLGAKYEPEIQLGGVELEPFTPGKEKYHTYNREDDGAACIGQLTGEFGRQGDRFFSHWHNRNTKNEADWSGISPEFHAELHRAVYALRKNMLADFDSMVTFCRNHPEARLPERPEYEHYGFKFETEKQSYFMRNIINASSYDSRFSIYAYDKDALALEKSKAERPSALENLHSRVQRDVKAPSKDKTLKSKDAER